MKSWKTTAAGIVAGLIAALNAPELKALEPSWMVSLTPYLGSIAIALMGVFARDNSVTSEQAGAK